VWQKKNRKIKKKERGGSIHIECAKKKKCVGKPGENKRVGRERERERERERLMFGKIKLES